MHVQDTTSERRRRRLVAPIAAGLALTLGLAACGDSNDDEGATPTTAGANEDPTTTEAGGGETVEITAVDFAFEGVPDTVVAGTRFTLTNESEGELHEFVAARLPDDETRSAEELVSDPANLEALLGGGPPDAVVLAAPGGDMPGAVVGDGTFTEPGRYLMVCSIPTGVDAEAYLNAPPSDDGPPQVEGADGPPHFTMGMFAEFTVE